MADQESSPARTLGNVVKGLALAPLAVVLVGSMAAGIALRGALGAMTGLGVYAVLKAGGDDITLRDTMAAVMPAFVEATRLKDEPDTIHADLLPASEVVGEAVHVMSARQARMQAAGGGLTPAGQDVAGEQDDNSVQSSAQPLVGIQDTMSPQG